MTHYLIICLVFLCGITSLSADMQDSPARVEPITITETNLTENQSQSELQTDNEMTSDSLDKPVA